LDESGHLIKGTAADTEPDSAVEPVQIMIVISLWQSAWIEASENRQKRILLVVQAKGQSDTALD